MLKSLFSLFEAGLLIGMLLGAGESPNRVELDKERRPHNGLCLHNAIRRSKVFKMTRIRTEWKGLRFVSTCLT